MIALYYYYISVSEETLFWNVSSLQDEKEELRTVQFRDCNLKAVSLSQLTEGIVSAAECAALLTLLTLHKSYIRLYHFVGIANT